MKKSIGIIALIFASVIVAALLLRVARKPRELVTGTKSVEVQGVVKTIDIQNVKITNENNDETNSTSENTGIENILIRLITESKESATEKTSEGVRLINGEWVKETYTYTEYKKIPVDSDAVDVTEYIQIARETTTMSMPDNVVPVVEVQGETIIVTFPWHYPEGTVPYPAPDYYAQIAIDIKTKTVLWELGGG